jgi:probable rRNA maturation factor
MKFELYQSKPFGVRYDLVKKITAAIARGSRRFQPSEISVAIVDNQEIKKLNTLYRKQNKITDVLSFAERDIRQNNIVAKNYLGEIVIAYPRAASQARENKHSVQREIANLLIHGFLHLSGYDHQAPGPARLMKRYEQKIAKMLKSIK